MMNPITPRLVRRNPFSLLRMVVLALALGGAFGWSTAAVAAESLTAKKQFDLASGPADRSLKQLAEQSGREVLFLADAVEGVQTRAVKGEMTPKEALDTMLTGTVLVSVQDEKTGSLSVRREASVADAEKNGSSRPASSPAARVSGAGTGVIIGTVSNQASRQYLRSAEIRVGGTNLSATTESDGSYRLSNVPAGDQKVVVIYTGLDSETRDVRVTAGEIQRQDFALKSEVYQLQQFTVAGDREGQARAINDQKNAEHMKSIVASDAFGDLIDSNAAELLKSLPGFAINYGGEDAVGFTMRGQSSTNASITLDGNGISNTGLGGRSLNMRNVQLNNVESIEVNRAPDASSPANSLGGSVNLVSKSAFSQKGRSIRVDLGMNINTALSQFGPSYQANFGNYLHAQFPTGQINYSEVFRQSTEHPVGVAVSLLKGARYRWNTTYNPAYSFVPGLVTGQQVDATTPTTNPAIATGARFQEASAAFRQDYYSVNLDYKVSENTSVYLRNYFQEGPQYTLFGITHILNTFAANQTAGTGAATVAINGNSDDYIDSRPNATPVGPGSSTGSRIQKTTNYNWGNSHNQNYAVSAGGKTQLGDLGLTYGGYFGHDASWSPISPGFAGGGTLTYDVTNIGFIQTNIQSDSYATLKQTSGPDYKDVSNYGRLAWSGSAGSTIDRKWGGKIDAKREFNLHFPVTVQTGVAIDLQDRIAARTGSGVSYTFGSGPDGAFGTADDVALPLGQFADDHMPGRWNMTGFTSIDPGDWIDMKKLADYVALHPEAATANPSNDVTGLYGALRNFHEEIDAAYAMATVKIGKFSVVPGVRWERTYDKGSGWGRRTLTTPTGLTPQQQADFIKPQYFPLSRKSTYSDYYPNLQARYNLTDNLILRSAYTQTIGRPDFGSLLPGDTVNDTNLTISRTNPDLKPFNAKSYDISMEYYIDKSTGQITASVFRKDISNYTQSVQFPLPGGADNGYDGQYAGYTVTTTQNIPATTRTEGFELGYLQALRFLPGRWKNLSANLAYSYAHSTPPPGSLGATNVYPNVYNAGFTYSDGRVRVDLKWNMRTKWLSSVNNTTNERLYFRSNGRWDASFNYRFARKYTFYFDWRAFNNPDDFRTTGPDNRVQQNQKYGTSINTGLRADF